jgi:type II secretory pathway pseudopilin PulG
LIELLVVVTCLALLASLAMPQLAHARETGEATLMFSRMRTAAVAFEMYSRDHGTFPASSEPGTMPGGMNSYLERFQWTIPSPLGGAWVWDRERHGFQAAVSVMGHQGTRRAMTSLDRRVDNGDLETGILRARPEGHSYVLR